MNLRSLLYVPADNEAFINKAHTRGADAIILDLEDAVLEEDKARARENLAASITCCKQSGAAVFVRINHPREMALSDAKAALLGHASGIYVAKASVKHLKELDAFLTVQEAQHRLDMLPVVALIETPKDLLKAEKIARQPRVIALSVGSEDLATTLGAEAEPEVLRLPKQLVHFAAKSCDLMSFGTFRSVVDFTDLDAIRSAAMEAKRFGFDGASCVHPEAVPILNAAFSPSGAEIDWAKAVLQKAEQSHGAFEYKGKMVDAPVLKRARTILVRSSERHGSV